MARPIVEELNFTEFRRALEAAIVTNARIIPTQTERWADYVAKHRVRETNFQAYAAGKYENLEPVIIDSGPPWGGYYLWSVHEEVVLRWRRATE
jgi:hypothetical protein